MKINQLCVKGILTILFLKVPEFATSLRSLSSLFQQLAGLYRQKIAAQF